MPARPVSPPRAQAAVAATPEMERVVSAWPSLLSVLQNEKAATAAFLGQAWPVALQPGDPPQVQVGLPKGCEFHRDSLQQTATRQHIEKVFGSLLGHTVIFEFRVVEELPERPADRALTGSARTETPAPTSLNGIAELFEGRLLPGEG